MIVLQVNQLYKSFITARRVAKRCADPGANWRTPETTRCVALPAVRRPAVACRQPPDQRQRGKTGFR